MVINEPVKFLDTKRDKAIAILNWGETRLRQLYGKKIIVENANEEDWVFTFIDVEDGKKQMAVF